MEINDTLGREAGDRVILECLHRIDRECADGMLMFRIGGDEFAMLTGLSDRAAAEALGAQVHFPQRRAGRAQRKRDSRSACAPEPFC